MNDMTSVELLKNRGQNLKIPYFLFIQPRRAFCLWLMCTELGIGKAWLCRLLKFQGGDGPERLSRIASTNSQALRQHFHELTVSLLQPFEAAIQARPQEDGAGEDGPPLQAPFSHAEFLKGLEKPGIIQPLVLSCFANKV